MSRRFRVHDRRAVADLGGIWDFAFLGDVDPNAVDVAAIAYPDCMAVPGCFDTTPAYVARRGLVAYRTTVLLRDQTPHRLVFDGVHHWCRVFVNGRMIREHVGGFTRFSADIVGHSAGAAEIVVLVDNRIDYQRCPLHLGHYDWYHHGGITRSVELHRLGGLWINDLRVVTDDLARRRVTVTVSYDSVGARSPTRLCITCDGREAHSETINLTSSAGQIVRTLELPAAKLWSPEAPNLHLLHVQLGDDDLRERIGIRQVRVEGRQVLLNNVPLRLMGFCRHEMHPQFGHCQPEPLLVSDIQRLRDMNCNFVRGSHYPQDPLFLDLCDEVGLCVWCEGIGWQNTLQQMTDPHFISAQCGHLTEMVATAANHASVIMWGVLNEMESNSEASRAPLRTLLAHLRGLDPTRPLTYASCRHLGDTCFDLADIVSLNIYPGWYFEKIDGIPGWIDDLLGRLDAEKGTASKPVIISEVGAGAIPGWRDDHGEHWSEQYQAQLLETVIRHLFTDRDRVCGLAIWLYNDFRTPASVGRPRSYNDKGVVDEYRRPKLAYAAVKRAFASLKQEKGVTTGSVENLPDRSQ